jgi:anti-sigma regulatory factor (Ser/Thr protein kinase)
VIDAPLSEETEELLELAVPPLAAFVGTVRAFVAAAARYCGAEEDDVADLKVAVSEACGGAVRASSSDSDQPIRLAVLCRPHELVVEIRTPARPRLVERAGEVDPDLPPRRLEEAVRATMIDALFPQARIEKLDHGLAVRFAVSLIPPEPPE